MNEGWAMPLVVVGTPPTKFHYFIDNRSLCGKWLILGRVHVAPSRDDDDPGNCAECRRKLRKRRAGGCLDGARI